MAKQQETTKQQQQQKCSMTAIMKDPNQNGESKQGGVWIRKFAGH